MYTKEKDNQGNFFLEFSETLLLAWVISFDLRLNNITIMRRTSPVFTIYYLVNVFFSDSQNITEQLCFCLFR